MTPPALQHIAPCEPLKDLKERVANLEDGQATQTVTLIRLDENVLFIKQRLGGLWNFSSLVDVSLKVLGLISIIGGGVLGILKLAAVFAPVILPIVKP